MNKNYLKELGVFGYAPVEPVILAALASGDPLLLVGKAGTGKTFLLNSLSEALGLEHRHYNASLIAFDDLVGFPWPDEKTGGIRYIETPATVWQAESMLIDEINRCKPEHQNRLFSLIQERRIQGLKLEKLRYRWAAMNPPGFEQDGESYSGVEPLDSALADRFAFVVNVSDWADLGEEDQKLITDPRGEGQISRDQCGLAAFIKEAQAKLAEKTKAPPPVVLEYCRAVATTLGQAGLRISPRRVRQLARNLLALECVSSLPRERLFRLGLQWSLPQRTGIKQPDDAVIAAAHRTAWDSVALEGDEKWLHEFHLQPDLPKKVEHLLTCTNPDIGTVAVSQFLATATPHDSAVFAYSLFPALLENPGTVVGEEGLHDLGNIARDILHIDLTLKWRNGLKTPYSKPGGGRYEETHPDLTKIEQAFEKLSTIRRQRGLQLLLHLVFVKNIGIDDPAATEALLNSCVRRVKKHHEAHRTQL
jgi:MoxR-like ATPase